MLLYQWPVFSTVPTGLGRNPTERTKTRPCGPFVKPDRDGDRRTFTHLSLALFPARISGDGPHLSAPATALSVADALTLRIPKPPGFMGDSGDRVRWAQFVRRQEWCHCRVGWGFLLGNGGIGGWLCWRHSAGGGRGRRQGARGLVWFMLLVRDDLSVFDLDYSVSLGEHGGVVGDDDEGAGASVGVEAFHNGEAVGVVEGGGWFVGE